MNDKKSEPREIVFKVRRFNPEKDNAPYWQDFKIVAKPGMTVLDGLHEIKANHDSTLALRYSCRMGVCGSCAMLINGKPSLACNTQVSDICCKVLSVAPLPNFDIIKDLVPDLAPMLEKHRKLNPHILREDEKEMEKPSGEFFQTPEELVKYLQFSYCIRCGACMAACPTLATDEEYLGPMPLAQGHRYDSDTRDGGFNERKKIAGDTHGAFRCHYGGECSNVCPKGVDPARAIQLMKRDLVFDYLKLKKKKTPSCPLGKPEHSHKKEGIPTPPPFTVK
jgi:succinate dehydrogenase / fumarate reductase, iron-sulfur subunit